MSSQAQRAKRILRVLARAELYTVVSEHGGYVKLAACWRRASGGARRVGTFARMRLGTKLSDTQKKFLVAKSINDGRVLSIDETAALLLDHALNVLNGDSAHAQDPMGQRYSLHYPHNKL